MSNIDCKSILRKTVSKVQANNPIAFQVIKCNTVVRPYGISPLE